MPNKAAKQLEKIRSDKKLLIILIFSMVAIFVWIAVSLLTASKKQLASPDLTKMAEPLVPTLDQELLDKLGGQQYFDSEQLGTFPIYVLVELDSGEHSLVNVVNQSVQDFSIQREAEKQELDAGVGVGTELDNQEQLEEDLELVEPDSQDISERAEPTSESGANDDSVDSLIQEEGGSLNPIEE
jgi:hypothetical protein